MYTYQDFIKEQRDGVTGAVEHLITEHSASRNVIIARDADKYDRQQNTTITSYVRALYTETGKPTDAATGANNRLCSNFFQRLNTQRMAYSLGNGITFTDESTKPKLGGDIDTVIKDAGYYSLIHGVSFLFFNVDHVHVFRLTEFAPLWDEETGALMAGIYYWQVDPNKPCYAVLYEVDGFTKFRGNSSRSEFVAIDEKRPYRVNTIKTPMDAEPEVVGAENYNALPIVPLYGSRLKQSTLVGVKGSIDAYDLISSGFANDLQDCSEIYWIVTNAGGMDDADLAHFRDRLRLNHIANVENADDVAVTPYTQEVPFNSREAFLKMLRGQIYEGFGALDTNMISAANTNDHIAAAYQPLDENADDFEFQIITAVRSLLALIGIDDTPQFKRNRISNDTERTDMILKAAQYLDDRTVLTLLPFISPDMIETILENTENTEINRFNADNTAFDDSDE